MLGDFVQLKAEELKKKESDAKKKAEDENAVGGKRIRDAAVSGMEGFTGQKGHKSATDAMADEIKDVTATHAELRTIEIESQKMQADNLSVQQQMLQNSKHMQAQMASINASMQATSAPVKRNLSTASAFDKLSMLKRTSGTTRRSSMLFLNTAAVTAVMSSGSSRVAHASAPAVANTRSLLMAIKS